jgi:hypothetical protein
VACREERDVGSRLKKADIRWWNMVTGENHLVESSGGRN